MMIVTFRVTDFLSIKTRDFIIGNRISRLLFVTKVTFDNNSQIDFDSFPFYFFQSLLKTCETYAHEERKVDLSQFSSRKA